MCKHVIIRTHTYNVAYPLQLPLFGLAGRGCFPTPIPPLIIHERPPARGVLFFSVSTSFETTLAGPRQMEGGSATLDGEGDGRTFLVASIRPPAVVLSLTSNYLLSPKPSSPPDPVPSPSSSQASKVKGVGLTGEPTALNPDPADEPPVCPSNTPRMNEAHTHILRSLDPEAWPFPSVVLLPYRRSLPGVPAFSRSFGC